MSANLKKKEYDLIILGGGLVGLTFANLCADQGLSLALIESQDPVVAFEQLENNNVHNYDSRCSAITRSSENVFKSLGIWEKITQTRISAYQHMLIFDSTGFGEFHFDAEEVGEPNLGYILENRILLEFLWEKALSNPNIQVLHSLLATEVDVEEHSATLTLNNDKYKAKLIVGADGAKSWLKNQVGIKSSLKNYQQSALVANVVSELPHHNTARQRFLKDEPLAFLPLSDPHINSIVWSAEVQKTEFHLSLSDEKFCEVLSHAFDYRLGKIQAVGKRQAFPLSMQHAKNYVQERIALIGDAAHVIHPLAGQGVNLGFSDAKVLAEVLAKTKKDGDDIGNYSVLRKYERARKGQVLQTLHAMNFFKEVFGSQLPFLNTFRSLTLNRFNKSLLLKKFLIQKALH